MAKARPKIKAKKGRGIKRLMMRAKVKPYIGDETKRQKMRGDSLQNRVDSLRSENDSLRNKIKEYEILMKVEWKEGE